MEYLAYLAYSAGWRLVRLLPEGVAYGLFRRIAGFVYRRNGRQVSRLRSNLEVVTGLRGAELEAMTQRAMESYLRYWCDAFRLPDWSRARILDTVEILGLEHLKNATQDGRGAVISLPHSGNWDHAGAWATLSGWKVVTVAEVLRPQRLFERFLHYRNRLGFEVHPFGAPSIFSTLTRAIEGGALVALVSDRDLSRAGVPVTFFGRPTKMPKGPAALALATGAELIPAHVAYLEGGIQIIFSTPIRTQEADRDAAIADLTQQAANVFADEIAKYPEDWHMLQRIWTD
jgi:phosphatidylinositol dimannoside acyltransferase